MVLFGVNGAGKSTLLNILSTRFRPRKGSYTINGKEAWEDPEWSRNQLISIGHYSHLYGHLTPVENLQFFADLRDLQLSEAKIKEAVEAVGLKRFMRRPVRGFSAGMRKRVALARVLLASPSLLLLDEPYTALDVHGVQWLNGILADYLKQGGTMIMATHDPDRVAALSHIPMRMSEGKLIADTLNHGYSEEEELQVC
uniref:Cytochrome c biogenesis ATP-binding export protein ccmA n=1 Tax=Magnetococcus massalia (strain MO-1) TaxID=451514 RepID=A0A1S7LLY3_MAGMO|nr:Cytochrome c biogenesis ATP-binding export protein ccmA [Candidatus Magnetococcus massalia]